MKYIIKLTSGESIELYNELICYDGKFKHIRTYNKICDVLNEVIYGGRRFSSIYIEINKPELYFLYKITGDMCCTNVFVDVLYVKLKNKVFMKRSTSND